ncbi:unnamed protein product, partial [Ectocarpus sp. 12 AP-2014]
ESYILVVDEPVACTAVQHGNWETDKPSFGALGGENDYGCTPITTFRPNQSIVTTPMNKQGSSLQSDIQHRDAGGRRYCINAARLVDTHVFARGLTYPSQYY